MQALHLLMKQRVNETLQHFGYLKNFQGVYIKQRPNYSKCRNVKSLKIQAEEY